ncbi:MAG: tetratricopeptide repeat protein [Burkholderiales bacterium]|nr:tetratricopeptide repeat protein [Burkholderiales bacterium]
MAEQRSRYAAAPSRASRLVSTPALLGITALVVAVLAMLFPKRTLLEGVREPQSSDRLAAAYVRGLLRTQPDDQELRLLLVEKELALGELRQAEKTLAGLGRPRTPALERQAALQRYRIAREHAFELPPGSGARAAAEADLAARLVAMAPMDWDDPELVYLAREAAAAGDARLAGRYYARLALHAQHIAPEALEEAARHAVGIGDHSAAAALYFALQGVAPGRDAEREWFLRGVAALEASGSAAVALAAAEKHLGGLADDEAVLRTLIRLARAANDGARAQAYARRLLRMTPAAARASPLAAVLDWLVGAAHAADAPGGAAPHGIRPYDEASYRLAFEVFLANGNLADAIRVASAAVAQRPDDIVWRERLAQAAEWDGRPELALEQWKWLFARTGSARAAEGVLRLAPGLADDEALLAVWMREAARRPLAPEEAARLVEMFEGAGRPHDGIAWLEGELARGPRADLLEALAFLHERTGRRDEAIRSYERLAAAAGLTPRQALTLASLHIAAGDFRKAYEALGRARERAAPGDTAYWTLLGDLAWQLAEDEAAIAAYVELESAGKGTRDGLARLTALTRARQPREAARFAETAWDRYRDPAALVAALDIHLARGDVAAAQRLLARVAPADEALLARTPYFFVLRGTYRVRVGDNAGAAADYRRALALQPGHAEFQAALLWFLVDTRNLPELRRELARLAPAAERASVLWAPSAAGYLALGEPRRALAFFQRELAAKRDDYLWLLNYAEALEDAGFGGQAWRVRRHAWMAVRAGAAADPAAYAKGEPLLAYARLAVERAPGDASLAAVRRVLRQDRGDGAPLAGARRLDAAERELVVAWAISTEQNEAAKAWLWRQYGRRLAQPLWAEVSVALAENDTETLQRLVEGNFAALPRYNQVDAARALGAIGLAQSAGFAAQERYPADDEVHTRLVADVLDRAGAAVVDFRWFEYQPVAGTQTGLAAPVWVRRDIRVAPYASWISQRSSDTSALRVPAHDNAFGVEALFVGARSETDVAVGYRSAFAGFPTAAIRYARPLGARLSGEASAGYNLRAFDTAALLVAGVQDQVRASVFWNLARREYLSAAVSVQRYYTQNREWLANGAAYEIEAGYRIRTAYPDWRAWVYAAQRTYSGAGTPGARYAALTPDGTVPAAAFFIPEDNTYASLNVGFGDEYRPQLFVWDRRRVDLPYSRGVRPFATLGVSWSSVLGAGWNALLGAGGSVLGSDYLAAYALHSDGGAGALTTVREVGLRYQYFF